MALLLLSRAYLYMEEWENAAFYAGKLIKDWANQFQVNDLNGLIAAGLTNVDPAAENSTDRNLWVRQFFYNDFKTFNNPDVIWLYDASRFTTAITGTEMFGGNSPRNNSTYGTLTLASNSLIESYSPDDLRLRTYFVRSLFDEPNYDTAERFNPGSLRYRAYGKVRISNNQSGLPSIELSNRFLPFTEREFGSALRFTEAYLTLAEAQAMLGRGSEALQTLADVWNRRFEGGSVPASYTSGDPVEVVRRERRRELAFESLRWFDLRRWGRPSIEHVWYNTEDGTRQVFVLEQNDPGYTLPMPHTILGSNRDLSQVPLYDGGLPRRPRTN
jgi:hypothetical protein